MERGASQSGYEIEPAVIVVWDAGADPQVRSWGQVQWDYVERLG